MDTSRGRWIGLGPVLAVLICLWLGIGPLLAVSSLWQTEAECCCGSGSACLLGGCDCGRPGKTGPGDCGGLRSADGANDDAVAISFARHAGLIPIDVSVVPVLPSGRIDEFGTNREDLPTRTPDPPPPRFFGAL